MVCNAGVVKGVAQGTMMCKKTVFFYWSRLKIWELANGMENKKNGSVVKN